MDCICRRPSYGSGMAGSEVRSGGSLRYPSHRESRFLGLFSQCWMRLRRRQLDDTCDLSVERPSPSNRIGHEPYGRSGIIGGLMSPEQERRLHVLSSGPCVSGSFIRDYYGLAWPFAQATASAVDQYRKSSRRPEKCPDDHFSRIDIEGFMVRSDLLTRKWMAARLGMTADALARVLEKLDGFGMQRSRYEQGSEFMAESLREDLIRHVPGMRFRSFGDHTAFCERLHAELNRAGVVIDSKDKLFCVTSTKLGQLSS